MRTCAWVELPQQGGPKDVLTFVTPSVFPIYKLQNILVGLKVSFFNTVDFYQSTVLAEKMWSLKQSESQSRLLLDKNIHTTLVETKLKKQQQPNSTHVNTLAS